MSSETRKRHYDATRRREQAQRTRAEILSVARRCFLTDGYEATTISAVAAEAGSSVESIYKSFGGKPRLVKAVFDAELAGVGTVPSDAVAHRLSAEERDPSARLRAFGALVAEIGPRVASVALLVRDAAVGDPELTDVWKQLNEERLARMTLHAERLQSDGHLRPDVTVQEARDVLWSLASPEFYDLLVRRRGWDVAKFGGWVGNAYVDALLPEHPTPLSE